MRKLILLAILVSSGIADAQELTSTEIIRKIDQTERVASSKGVARQTITTSGGKVRTLEMVTYSKNRNEKQLLVYTGPSRVRGDKILMLNNGDDIWFYTPKTDRVRHLASHARRQKVQGSDFAYEDMSGGNIEKDYTYTLLGEEDVSGTTCYKFELTPTKSGPHYTRLILWADKTKFITIQIDYDEDGKLLKRLKCNDIRNIDGHWYAMRLAMTNLKEGGETVMKTEEIGFDMDLPDDLFTTRNLKRR